MSKRKGDSVPEGCKPNKSWMLEAPVVIEDIINKGQECYSPSEGDVGIIQSISLKNFMCHQFLESCDFGPNVNFITGENGSGKSAILTALIVGLGGKAIDTSRGHSLKSFVKTGERTAEILIKLRNLGPDAYRGDVYGDSISVEQRITIDGSRTYKLKSSTGQVISNKREELTSVLDHFNIQVDNPVCVLTQEMSKQFLHTKSEADKYSFFMKATLLERMKLKYIYIKETKAGTQDNVEKLEVNLKELKQKYLEKKRKFENLASLDDMKQKLEELRQEMAWSLVRELQAEVQQLQEKIDSEESNCEARDKMTEHQSKLAKAERKCHEIQQRLDRIQEEKERQRNHLQDLGKALKEQREAQKEQKLTLHQSEIKLKHLEEYQNILMDRVKTLQMSDRVDRQAEALQRQRNIAHLKDRLGLQKRKVAKQNEEITDKQQDLVNAKGESERLRLEEKEIQESVNTWQRRQKQLTASRSNRLRKYGDRMPELLEAIDRTYAQGRFKKKPIGPIGDCIRLKDPNLAVAVESCLGGLLKSFCCDNYHDEKVLEQLMTKSSKAANDKKVERDFRPQIIVFQFSQHVYNVEGRCVKHPEYPSVLDTLHFTNPNVANCLIDMRGIETILIIKESPKARQVMQQGRPPKNCWEAFTKDGDQVFHSRYYSSDCSVVKYLGTDLEEEIRLVEAKLENSWAQLNSMKQHRCTVCQNINSLEAKLQSLIAKVKENQVILNEITSNLTELENAEVSQTDVISTLESEARENGEKIHAERRRLNEAKEKLSELSTLVGVATSKYKEAGCEKDPQKYIESLNEDMAKSSSECSRLERIVNNLEKKLNDHQENIEAMKSELTSKQGELEESVALAQQICPERLLIGRSPKVIDANINALQQKINVWQDNSGNPELIRRELVEAFEEYRKNILQLKDLQKFVACLDIIVNERLVRFTAMRRSYAFRCKMYFNSLLIKHKCDGVMKFDHDNETLSISVSPPDHSSHSETDMRRLSGGERSFSTVCFILSLWQIAESPFRCLDEFDVYMDMHNRHISMEILLAQSQQHKWQYIFITPLPLGLQSDLIKIRHLEHQHGSRKQANEDEEANN